MPIKKVKGGWSWGGRVYKTKKSAERSLAVYHSIKMRKKKRR